MNIIPEIEKRHSYRKYKDERVEEEKIDLIIKAGLLAPTGMNRQGTIFVHLKDDEKRDEFVSLYSKVTGRNNPFYGAKDIIVVLVKKEGGCYVYDGSLAMGNMMLEATHLGVQSCWIHHAKEFFDSEEGKNLLKKWNIKEDNLEGIASLIVGYASADNTPHKIVEGRVYKI